MTKADWIRGMTDEQLAEFLVEVIDCWYCPTYQECTNVKSCDTCDTALLAWLKQEHKEEQK
jgi:hypothetical protein